MTLFEQTLITMEHLLIQVNAPRWASRIREDLELWRSKGDASQHRVRYGGHSTYSDWVIHRQNGHDVSETQQAWIGRVFSQLQYLGQFLAEDPSDQRLERKHVNAIAGTRSVLGNAPAMEWSLETAERSCGEGVRTERCADCAYSETSRMEVETFMADDVVPGLLVSAIRRQDLIRLVDRVLAGRIKGVGDARRIVLEALRSENVDVTATWRPRDRCPACESSDMRVFRWDLAYGAGFQLLPWRYNHTAGWQETTG